MIFLMVRLKNKWHKQINKTPEKIFRGFILGVYNFKEKISEFSPNGAQ